MSITSRIEQSIERIPFSGCWLWMRSLRGNGYGQYTHANRIQEGAHRVAYKAFIGDIPDGMFVCHRCDVPSCVNPDHLFLGNARDNTRDCMSKGRLNPGRTGGPKKISDDQKLEILTMRKSGMLQREIAAIFGITQVRVSQLTRNI